MGKFITSKKSKNKLYILYLGFLCVALASLLFTNINYDAEYEIAMTYRFIKGDKPLLQMWEPHQTSVFVGAILMKLYLTIAHTTTGIVLYLQFCGLLIRGALGFLLGRTIYKYSSSIPAIAVFLLYLFFPPRESLIPEFGNMQLWFATLLFLSLVNYFEMKRTSMLVLSAVFLCLAILSYPSMLLAYFVTIYLLFKYSNTRMKDTFIFTTVCVVIGIAFLIYLFHGTDISTAISCVQHALSLEPSHTGSLFTKLWGHIKDLGLIVGLLGLFHAISFLLYKVVFSEKNGRKNTTPYFISVCSWYMVLAFLLYFICVAKYRAAFCYPLCMILVYGFLNSKLLDEQQRKLYDIAFAISLISLVATMLLSDQTFLQAIPFMSLVICISALPIYKKYLLLKEDPLFKRCFIIGLHLFFLIMVFRCIYLHIPISQRSQINTIIDDNSLIRTGPLKFIYTNEAGAAMHRDSYAEWQQYISDGDKVWIMAEPCDTMGYLYKDVEVSAPTVMSTPTYNESLEYYFQVNPEKMPDVIVVSSYCGTLSYEIEINEWILNWIETEYKPAEMIDGIYWRYYFRNPR